MFFVWILSIDIPFAYIQSNRNQFVFALFFPLLEALGMTISGIGEKNYKLKLVPLFFKASFSIQMNDAAKWKIKPKPIGKPTSRHFAMWNSWWIIKPEHIRVLSFLRKKLCFFLFALGVPSRPCTILVKCSVEVAILFFANCETKFSWMLLNLSRFVLLYRPETFQFSAALMLAIELQDYFWTDGYRWSTNICLPLIVVREKKIGLKSSNICSNSRY